MNWVGMAQAQSSTTTAAPSSVGDTLEEVVVTAERRSEDLQKTAISVTALSGNSSCGRPTNEKGAMVSMRQNALHANWAAMIGGLIAVGCWVTPIAAAAVPPGQHMALPDWSGSWSFEASPDPGLPPRVPGSLPAGIPLTPKYAALRAEAETKYGHGGGRMAKCLPAGVPGVLMHGLPFEFVLAPDRVVMIAQNGEVRRIHTDGRSHLAPGDLYQNIEGDSIGHWEGGTLVVDTIGMTADAELFVTSGLTVTPQTHIVERMHRKDAGTFQIETTMIDPAIFTKPYVVSKLYGDAQLGDFEVNCTEHMRDTEDNIDLTPPPSKGAP